VRQAGVLRVGHAVEAPYADLEADGRVSGESPENARRIAARAGLPHIEWVQVEFDQLIEGLQAGRFDLVAAGLFITPERSRQLLFSDPRCACAWAGCCARTRRPAWTAAMPRHCSSRACALPCCAARPRRRCWPATRACARCPTRAGRLAVLRGAADALALSLPTVRALARQGRAGRCRRAPPCPPAPGLWSAPARSVRPRPAGWALPSRPEDRALQARWNQAQAAYLGSPEHLQVLTRFGLGADDLPLPAAPPGPGVRHESHR
jgi:polar amino acid transport system substrate-binding protein